MRASICCLSCVFVSTAWAQPSTGLHPGGKAYDATHWIVRVTNLTTGASFVPAAGAAATRGELVAYDTLTPPPSDPPLPANVSVVDENGVLICPYPTDGEPYFIPWFGMSNADCTDGTAAPVFQGRSLELLFDDYEMDPLVAGDPSVLQTIARIDGAFFAANPPADDATLVIGTAEWVDYDSDGVFECLDFLAVTFGFDPNSPAGLYTFELPLPENFQIHGYGTGAVSFNWTAGSLPGMCGIGQVAAGGCGGGGSDPNDPEFWVFHSLTDPNEPGEPRSCTDIWNSPSGVVLVFATAGGQALPSIVPLRLYIDVPNPCGVDGGDADVNDDGSVNIADLGLVLSNFNAPGTHNQGDANNDGTVNVTDLGGVLALFNTSGCPY